MQYKTLLTKIGVSVALLTLGITGASATEFSDIGGRDDRAAIEFLKQNNVVKGYNDGSYKPEQKISRAEFLKILLETAVAEKKECSKTEVQNIQKIFSDVKSDEWFAEYVCTGYNSGFINGYADKTFKPQQEISLAEASKIIALVQELTVSDASTSSVSGEESEWFEPFLQSLEAQRAIKNDIKNTPAGEISRGDMADMIWRVATGNEIIETDEPQEITSCEILSDQIQKANKRSGNFSFQNNIRNLRTFGAEEEIMFDTVTESVAVPMMAKTSSLSPAESNSGASDDFSSTNIQEKGVDEADIIKNDGSHIFYARGEDIKIVRAYPSSEMKEEAEITVENMRISELFLDGDTLILLGQKTQNYDTPVPYASSKMIAPEGGYYYGNAGIEVRIFNIKDRSNPEQTRSVSLDGNLVSSRRVGETLYLVSNNYLPYRDTFTPEILPILKDGDEEITIAPKCGNIHYFPNFQRSNLTSIVAVDTKNPDEKITLKSFLGAGDNIYASPQNLYVVQNGSEQVFSDEDGVAKWNWENISKISRISLNGLEVDFEAQGKVWGRVLNQYSMSEFENNFRIATTQNWGKNAGNNVFILDESLNELGKITGIAPGEQIKSVRFMGERGFVVTFKAVDPLFVIDMTPHNPKILGELKIPGWSDYLHPIDDNYLIGFGKEVNAESENNDRLTWDMLMGMKLAIFDVSDLSNPKEIHKTIIGDRGTSSEILHNPRALFYDANRKLIGFPVEVRETYTRENGYESEKTVFAGAQIYNFSIEDGFSKKGEVSHFPEFSSNFWDENYKISRIVRIGENFYSSSKGLITALSSDMTPEKTISFFEHIPCSEISDQFQCSQNTTCKALYSMPICEEGTFCIQMMQFDKCVEK